MCIYCYGVYCSRVKREPDPEVLSEHSQGSTTLLSDANRMRLLGTFILKRNSAGTANPDTWMRPGTSVISHMECQSIGEKKEM